MNERTPFVGWQRRDSLCCAAGLAVTIGLVLPAILTAQQLSPTQSAPAPVPDIRPAPSDYSIVERGPHHRIWQRVLLETNRLGKILATTNSYTELQTGMHWKNARGQWVESSTDIQVQADGGAIATNLSHRLYFPG